MHFSYLSPRRRSRTGWVLITSALLLGATLAWLRCGPLPPGFLDPTPRRSTLVLARGGEPLYEALSEQGARSQAIAAHRLPEVMVQATLAAEDKRFFSHTGVDVWALGRAIWRNARAGRFVQGGSTITQQVVKLLSERRRTLAGKLRELVLAQRLEHQLAKREILALYLSLAPYGNQYVGVEAAAEGYFGTPPENLTPAQAAFLAGLPQRPTALDPYRNRKGAVARQSWVLARMQSLGFLDANAAAAARRERLELRRPRRSLLAPHFVERAREQVRALAPATIRTTLDAALQQQVRGILAAHQERLEAHGAHTVAVAVLDNARGEWLAWEGSGDYLGDDGGAIDGVTTPRQPGSALKPFTYALAFDRGFTPATLLPDIPSHFPTAEPGVHYSPRNYDGRFRGPMRVRAALAGSENVPAVWTLSQVGVADLLRLLRRAGLTTLDKTSDHYGFGLTMGDAEVRLDELVGGYAALARGGQWRQPRLLLGVTDAAGRERFVSSPALPIRVVSERAAYWIADILQDRDARAFIFGSGGSLDFPFPVAVKTGTSQAYRDNWTLGFTREVTVGVWVGNFDREPLRRSSGVTGAAPIFHDVMLAAQVHVAGALPAESAPPLLPRPAELRVAAICALSGMTATALCPRVDAEWLPSAAPPCAWHRRQGGRTVVQWPARYRGWARDAGLLVSEAAPVRAREPWPPAATPTAGSARSAIAPDALKIVNPPPGAVYLRDPTLRAEYQTLPLRALAEAPGRTLTWHVDGTRVGEIKGEASLDWPLALGRHRVAVVDDLGRRDETTIVVK